MIRMTILDQRLRASDLSPKKTGGNLHDCRCPNLLIARCSLPLLPAETLFVLAQVRVKLLAQEGAEGGRFSWSNNTEVDGKPLAETRSITQFSHLSLHWTVPMVHVWHS